MRKLNLTALLIGAALFTGLGVTYVSAENTKCGAGKCGSTMMKPIEAAGKCGTKQKATKGVAKCGAEKKTVEKATKCGTEKKAVEKAAKCGGNK